MTKNYDDIIPEEQEQPEIPAQLQALYQADSKNLEALTRMRRRLLEYTQQHPQLEPVLDTMHVSYEPEKEEMVHILTPRRKHYLSWSRRFNSIAAVVAVAVLVSALVATFTLFHRTNNNASRRMNTISSPMPFLLPEQFHPINATTAWVSTSVIPSSDGIVAGPLLRTTDGGQKWQDVTPPQQSFDDVISMLYPLDGTTAWLSSTTHFTTPILYHTTNGGASWQAFSTPNNIFVNSLDVVDSNHIWLFGIKKVSQNAQLFTTSDGGKHWEQISDNSSSGIPTLNQQTQVQFINADTGWLTITAQDQSQKLYVTHNGGRLWQPLSVPHSTAASQSGQYYSTNFFVKFFDAQHGYLIGSLYSAKSATVKIYPTQDGGNTWQPASNLSLHDNRSYARFLNDHQLISTSPTSITLYTHIANQWVSKPLQVPDGVHILTSEFASSSTALLLEDYTKHTNEYNDTSSDDLRLLKTTNGGHSWTTIHLTPPTTNVTPYSMVYVVHPGWTYFTAHEGSGSSTFSPRNQSVSDNLNPAHLPHLTVRKWLVRFMCNGTNNANLTLNGKKFSTPNCDIHPVSTIVSFNTAQPVQSLNVTLTSQKSWLVAFQACTNEQLCKPDNA